MSFKETYKIVTDSKVFKDFISSNPNAKFCAGFFILDFLSNDNKRSIDYKVTDAKIFTFELKDDNSVKMIEDKALEIPDKKLPELKEISPDINIEIDELKGIAGLKALDEGIHAKFNKIIAILQKLEDKEIWNLTCMLDGLIILNVLIDAHSGDIIKFERKSFMDLIRKK